MKKRVIALGFLILIVISCRKIMPKSPNEDELLDGPIEGLTTQETAQFLKGDVAFNDGANTQLGTPDIPSPSVSFGSAIAKISASVTASKNPKPVLAGGNIFEKPTPLGNVSG